MSATKLLGLLMVLVCLCLVVGCEESSESDSSSSSAAGSFGGTWTGTTAGRQLTMVITQNGTALTGSYNLTDPAFGESFSGTVSSETAPATATLIAGADRRFEINFASYNSLSGGFFKGATQVGAVAATK
jgi:hypothetical protein